jgi:hypothetical protein
MTGYSSLRSPQNKREFAILFGDHPGFAVKGVYTFVKTEKVKVPALGELASITTVRLLLRERYSNLSHGFSRELLRRLAGNDFGCRLMSTDTLTPYIDLDNCAFDRYRETQDGAFVKTSIRLSGIDKSQSESTFL